MLADIASQVCDENVFGMHGVDFERGTVAESGDEACVVGARELQQIAADAETLNLRDDGSQTLEPRDVLITHGLLNVRAIFPDHNVCQHIFTYFKNLSNHVSVLSSASRRWRGSRSP